MLEKYIYAPVIVSSLFHAIACRLGGTKLLPEPAVDFYIVFVDGVTNGDTAVLY